MASQNVKIKTDHGDLCKTESAKQFEPINIKVVSKQRTIHLIPHLSTGLWRIFLPGAPPWRPSLLFFQVQWRSWIWPPRRKGPRAQESAGCRDWVRGWGGFRGQAACSPPAIKRACSNVSAGQVHSAISNSFLLVDVGLWPRGAGIESIFLLLCHHSQMNYENKSSI